MAAEILSLEQQSRPARPTTESLAARDCEVFPDGERRRLSAARGVALGVALSLPVWAVLGAVAYFAF
ncbi:MAG: hypothetical protein BGO51_05405 [Rhodospirillales bacterium 69-11]|nr:hypothetical protein [Rhodospirillales bacterium]MBN8908205.1 hypothetical protein [Rhodospirillales bacterium]MBN8925714.1 hypothetical protein [Rhodospirillales bacterium]OJW27166.1 MAG: hypothetical protein BGO51_05405 [Rhodospirillales bacterium 69-11]